MAHSARLPMGKNNEQILPMGHDSHLSKSDAHYRSTRRLGNIVLRPTDKVATFICFGSTIVLGNGSI